MTGRPVPRAAAAVVPLVLLSVAALQIARVVAIDQSSWQGAGFGMFATYDFDDTRAVVAIAVGEDGSGELLPVEPIGIDRYRRARVTPTDEILREIGRRLVPTAPAGTQRVRIEVRGPRLEGDVVRHRVVNAVDVDV